MEEGVDEAAVVGEVRRGAEVRAGVVPGRERGERGLDDVEARRVLREPDAPEELLEGVDTRAVVSAVEHEGEDAVRAEDAGQRAKARVGVSEVMEDARAHDVVERLAERRHLREVERLHVEVLEIMAGPQAKLVGQRRPGHVDTRDLAAGVGEGQERGLVGPAAGDEDLEGLGLFVPGPQTTAEEQRIARVVDASPKVRSEIGDRLRIRPAVVLLRHEVAVGLHVIPPWLRRARRATAVGLNTGGVERFADDSTSFSRTAPPPHTTTPPFVARGG